MYNAEIKERFIEETAQNSHAETSLRSILRSVENAERKAGKDIAEMSHDEALASVDQLGINRMTTLYVLKSTVKQYLDWCRENHVFESVNDGFYLVLSSEFDTSPAIAKIVVKDDEDLALSMNQVCEFGNGYFEPVFLSLTWVGLSRQEIIDLKDKEVDFGRRVISINSSEKEYYISSNVLLGVLKQYSETSIGRRDNGTTTFEVYKDETFDTFIKRFSPERSTKKGKPLSPKNIDIAVYKFNKKYVELGNEPRLTYQNVFRSGRLFALWELERSGVDIFSPANKDTVIHTFSIGEYKRIILDYRAYKKAFSL